MNDLPELLDHYFSLGVAEGKEGRDHDTPTGEAQATRDLIECQILRLRDELANMTISRNGYAKQTSGRVSEARRQAFIEAAEIAEERMPVVQCMSVEPVVSACLDIASTLRAKAEESAS